MIAREFGGSFRKAGMKWYGSNMANREKGLPRSILTFILNDPDTGAPLAFMSANLLSAYRTGAIPGVGARHLARRDSRVVGLVGPGVMGKTTLMALMATVWRGAVVSRWKERLALRATVLPAASTTRAVMV